MLASLKQAGLLMGVIAGVSAGHWLCRECRAEDVSATRGGVLVLRNGRVLRGQIDHDGDSFTVNVADGQITISARDVEMVCADTLEAYWRKRAKTRVDDAREHARLADWCQRQGMLDEARRELAQAKALDPAEPTIALVERRIAAASGDPCFSGEPTGKPRSVVAHGELDRLTGQLPPGSVEAFTQTVQPILINQCATAGCHGPQTKSQFSLVRMPAGKPPTRRLTQRNLLATLKWIDRQNPASSPLLAAPIRPHGTAPSAVLSGDQLDQYRRIAEWVYQLAGRPQQPVAAVSYEQGARDQVPMSGAVFGDPGDLFAQPPPSGDSDEGGSTQEPLMGTTNGAPQSPGAHRQLFGGISRIRRGAPIPEIRPADPFDPEIFNRRFFPHDKSILPDCKAPRK